MTFDFNIFAGQPLLPTIWFVAIGIFWIGYLILDSFDLGVGMLMSIFAKNEKERRLLLNTIGPVWDGNEVWIVTGGAATFAAFPLWYASLFSALYIPLTFALLALIFRVIAIESRLDYHSLAIIILHRFTGRCASCADLHWLTN